MTDIKPNDRVTVDNGTTEYIVRAVGRAGYDVYLVADENAVVGTWVSIQSVRKAAR